MAVMFNSHWIDFLVGWCNGNVLDCPKEWATKKNKCTESVKCREIVQKKFNFFSSIFIYVSVNTGASEFVSKCVKHTQKFVQHIFTSFLLLGTEKLISCTFNRSLNTAWGIIAQGWTFCWYSNFSYFSS
jgi:hypothetical protein